MILVAIICFGAINPVVANSTQQKMNVNGWKTIVNDLSEEICALL